MGSPDSIGRRSIFSPKDLPNFSTLWDKPRIITTYAFEKYSSQTDPHTYTWWIEFKLGIPTSADIFVSISFYSDIGEEPWRPSAVTFSSVVIIITMHLCELLHISKTIRVFFKAPLVPQLYLLVLLSIRINRSRTRKMRAPSHFGIDRP